MSTEVLKALANANRLQIVRWLADPVRHFPSQRDGDLVQDGVCLGAIVRKLGLAQPTVTNHMRVLGDAGLVQCTRRATWTFFRLDSEVLGATLSDLAQLLPRAETNKERPPVKDPASRGKPRSVVRPARRP